MTTRPLAGVRVLDFTWVGAGSLTTKLLADHGAEVIKVESATHLDSLRMSPPFAGGIPGPNRSGYFADRNTGKRSLTLNMRSEAGRAIARRLADVSDVVANNFRPGVLDGFGLGYEALRATNPGVIYLAMSMQGVDGPHRDYLGYGLTIGALVGLHDLTGLPERVPCGTGTNYPDHVPNPAQAAFAVLAALRHRRRTGEGQLIDLAQTEATIAGIGAEIVRESAGGQSPTRGGNRHPDYAPHGVYPCAGDDRWLALAVHDDGEWRAARAIVGGDTLQPEYEHATARRQRADALDAAIAAATRLRDPYELMTELQAVGVAAGVVQTAADLIDRDPQLAHRDHWQRLPHPEMGESLYGAPPFRLSATPAGPLSPAPLLGEDTQSTLRDVLALDDDEISALAAEGALQ